MSETNGSLLCLLEGRGSGKMELRLGFRSPNGHLAEIGKTEIFSILFTGASSGAYFYYI
jgi:hypothetical protein